MVKAAKFQEEKEKEDPNITKLTFSQGWLEKFVNRNGLSVRRRTTEAQKSPDQLIGLGFPEIFFCKLCTTNQYK